MPLKKGSSDKELMEKRGMPQKQAVAAALRSAGKSKGSKDEKK